LGETLTRIITSSPSKYEQEKQPLLMAAEKQADYAK
jgi:hypothetical protein